MTVRAIDSQILTMTIIRGGAHGVAMFEIDRELKATIVKWLEARFNDTPAAAR